MFTTLSEEEIARLDLFLLERIDEEANTEDKDEGIIDISELDGLFTAIVSGPTVVQPSQWLPTVWGDFEPVWESEKDFMEILSLMMRHMNGIAAMFMEQHEYFEPLFLERTVKGKTYTIVDEWCEGYQRGVALTAEQWYMGGKEITVLLAPILAFTSLTNWRAHDFSDGQTETLQRAIIPNVRKIHAYWLSRQEEETPVVEPLRRSGLRAGRNDPCPCGSGKKFKKCCLQ